MNNLTFIVLLLSISFANAQSELWSLDVAPDGYINQQEDGKIIFKNEKEISLINNITGKMEWSKMIESDDNPIFLENLPIMYFEGKSYSVIDATTGLIIDESTSKTSVLDVHYYWDQSRVVMELERDKNLHVLNIDLTDVSKSWNAVVGEAQKVMFGLGTRSTTNAPSVANNGALVLVDKKYVSILDKDGNIKNRIEFEDNLSKEGFNVQKGIVYVLEDKEKLHFVEIATGQIASTIELDEKDLYLKVLDGGNTIGIIQKKDCKILDAVSGKEIGTNTFKDEINDVYVDEASQRYFLLAKKTIREVDQKTGATIIENTYDADFNFMKNVNDKLFVGGRGKINQIKLSDLSPIYSKSPRSSSAHDFIELGKAGRAYSYYAGEKYEIAVVDNQGKEVWDKDYETTYAPTLDKIGEGLLIISSTEANYLSIKEGKSIWKKTLEVGASFAVAADEPNNLIVMHSDKRLYFFNTADGSLTESSEKYKFKDFDYDTQQPQIIINGDRIFLKGSSSIYITDLQGNIIHSNHYKSADNTSGLMKLAGAAITVAAIGSGNAGSVLTVYQDDNMVHKGGLVDALNDNLARANASASARRAKQNTNSADYPHVFTRFDNGNKGLIFLDGRTGKEKFDVSFENKSPNYILDEIDGVLFSLDNSTLKALDVK